MNKILKAQELIEYFEDTNIPDTVNQNDAIIMRNVLDWVIDSIKDFSGENDMTNFNHIKNMSIDELADVLIIPGEIEVTDYDQEEELYTRTESCWYTPVDVYEGWYSKDDVKKFVLEWLQQEVE